MKIHIFIIICITILLACKRHTPDNQTINPAFSDSGVMDIGAAVQESRTNPLKTSKKVVFDTILCFQTVERIFEDEFYLVFINDSNELMRFYFIPAFSQQIDYSFISESEGDYTSNSNWEGKKFKISYTHEKQVNFTGETEVTYLIKTIDLLDKTENETLEKLIESMESGLQELKTSIGNIHWQDVIRNDSSVILSEEDFKYSHLKRIHQEFVEISDCSGDSVFRTYYADKTVHTGGTVPAIYWTLDFTLPSLNLSRGEDKASILAKLGTPSYDFGTILVYPKYVPDIIVEIEGGKKYNDTVFLVFENDKLTGIVVTFYFIC